MIRDPECGRCVGSPTPKYKYEGLVGVGAGALAVGLSICFIDPYPAKENATGSEEWVLHGCELDSKGQAFIWYALCTWSARCHCTGNEWVFDCSDFWCVGPGSKIISVPVVLIVIIHSTESTLFDAHSVCIAGRQTSGLSVRGISPLPTTGPTRNSETLACISLYWPSIHSFKDGEMTK